MAKRAAVKVKKLGRAIAGKRGRKPKAPGKGHNSAVPDETVVRCITLLDKDRKTMEKVKEELNELRGSYRARRKEFDKFGFNLHAYDATVKLRSMDLGRVQVDSADTGRYLRVIEHPLATQLELFQNMEAPTPAVDANLQGQQAGKAGEPADNNPHQPGTEQYVEWNTGWNTGQAMNYEGLKN